MLVKKRSKFERVKEWRDRVVGSSLRKQEKFDDVGEIIYHKADGSEWEIVSLSPAVDQATIVKVSDTDVVVDLTIEELERNFEKKEGRLRKSRFLGRNRTKKIGEITDPFDLGRMEGHPQFYKGYGGEDLICNICGEPWDRYEVNNYECMSEEEAHRFLKGEGCPDCKGVEPPSEYESKYTDEELEEILRGREGRLRKSQFSNYQRFDRLREKGTGVLWDVVSSTGRGWAIYSDKLRETRDLSEEDLDMGYVKLSSKRKGSRKRFSEQGKHYIGEKYQGGIIFHVNSDGKSGLIVSEEEWNATWKEAISIANNYSNDGYTDWYLPSIDELDLLCKQKDIIGGLDDKEYWSYSIDDTHPVYTYAYTLNFEDGEEYYTSVNYLYYGRAIRKFTDNETTIEGSKRFSKELQKYKVGDSLYRKSDGTMWKITERTSRGWGLVSEQDGESRNLSEQSLASEYGEIFGKLRKRGNMKKYGEQKLINAENLTGDTSKIYGDAKNISGDASYISGDVSNISGDIFYLEGDVTNIRGDANNIEGDTSYISGDVSNIKGCVSDIDGDVSDIKGYVSKIYGDVSNIRGDVSNIEGDVSNIRGDVSNIEGYVGRIRGNIFNIKGDVSDIKGNVSNIGGNATGLSGNVNDLVEQGKLQRIGKLRKKSYNIPVYNRGDILMRESDRTEWRIVKETDKGWEIISDSSGRTRNLSEEDLDKEYRTQQEYREMYGKRMNSMRKYSKRYRVENTYEIFGKPREMIFDDLSEAEEYAKELAEEYIDTFEDRGWWTRLGDYYYSTTHDIERYDREGIAYFGWESVDDESDEVRLSCDDLFDDIYNKAISIEEIGEKEGELRKGRSGLMHRRDFRKKGRLESYKRKLSMKNAVDIGLQEGQMVEVWVNAIDKWVKGTVIRDKGRPYGEIEVRTEKPYRGIDSYLRSQVYVYEESDFTEDELLEEDVRLLVGKNRKLAENYKRRFKKAQEEEEEKSKIPIQYQTEPYKKRVEVTEEEVKQSPQAIQKIREAYDRFKLAVKNINDINSKADLMRQETEMAIRKLTEEGRLSEWVRKAEGALQNIDTLLEKAGSCITRVGNMVVGIITKEKVKKLSAAEKLSLLLEKYGDDANQYLIDMEKSIKTVSEYTKKFIEFEVKGSVKKDAGFLQDLWKGFVGLLEGLWNKLVGMVTRLEEGAKEIEDYIAQINEEAQKEESYDMMERGLRGARRLVRRNKELSMEDVACPICGSQEISWGEGSSVVCTCGWVGDWTSLKKIGMMKKSQWSSYKAFDFKEGDEVIAHIGFGEYIIGKVLEYPKDSSLLEKDTFIGRYIPSTPEEGGVYLEVVNNDGMVSKGGIHAVGNKGVYSASNLVKSFDEWVDIEEKKYKQYGIYPFYPRGIFTEKEIRERLSDLGFVGDVDLVVSRL